MKKINEKLLIRAFCIWTAFVWLVLIKNMLFSSNESWAFRGIHIGLAIISLGFAALVWPLANRLDHRAEA